MQLEMDAAVAVLGRTPATLGALEAVTLSQLVAGWAVHDLGHAAQIVRTMARQYRDEVGAWKAYVPVLTR